ncbi:MAG: radical SAM protein [Nitrospiraceae bacterium]|nr:MAG: radical SAM protein [Nitrospiraceae bacterium]
MLDRLKELSSAMEGIIGAGEDLVHVGSMEEAQNYFKDILDKINAFKGVLLNNTAVVHIYREQFEEAEDILRFLIKEGMCLKEAVENYNALQALGNKTGHGKNNHKPNGGVNGEHNIQGQINILILGDSRVLPRTWENKKSCLEHKLKDLLCGRFSNIDFNMKTIAYPNYMLKSLKFSYDEILSFYPDVIIVNLNLCEFIPRSLPKTMFEWLDSCAAGYPEFVNDIRELLVRNRRTIHEIFGKNTWSSQDEYIKDLNRELTFLKSITEHIVFMGCLNTSESSEYIRPGFLGDIRKFNEISEQIVKEHDLYYVDLNRALEGNEYKKVSNDGIHYTDSGDDIIVWKLLSQPLEAFINHMIHEDFSVCTPGRPKYIQVELTNHCSVKCSMCELRSSVRGKGYMTKGIFSRVIEQLVAWGIPMVRFTLWGEALMHPEFTEFVKIAKANNLKVGFNTNGILLHERLMKELMDLKLDQIIFSVDSFDDDFIYKKHRPGVKSIHEINKTITDLIAMKKDLRTEYPEIRIQMIGTVFNKSQHDKFLEFWEPRVDNCRITHMYSMKPVPEMDRHDVEDADYFYECKYPWTTMGVYHNGDVTACCRDVDGRLKLGNIMEKTLLDIYYKAHLLKVMRKNLKRKNKNKMPELCKSCFKYSFVNMSACESRRVKA